MRNSFLTACALLPCLVTPGTSDSRALAEAPVAAPVAEPEAEPAVTSTVSGAEEEQSCSAKTYWDPLSGCVACPLVLNADLASTSTCTTRTNYKLVGKCQQGFKLDTTGNWDKCAVVTNTVRSLAASAKKKYAGSSKLIYHRSSREADLTHQITRVLFCR
jgi:hypothetical protein